MAEDYSEEAIAQREKDNDAYVREFDDWLMAQDLTDKTIQRHIDNVSFYLDTYLSNHCGLPMEDGCRCTDDFLGYFFIRKCMWSTPATIRQNATSFKKFYKCMLEKGHIAQESYERLLADIKEDLPVWVAECEEYNNPGYDAYDDPFGFGPDGRELFDAAYEAVARGLGLDALLGLGPEEDEDDADLPTRQETINELTLALLYLTSWEEGPKGGPKVRRSWKSADWDALDWGREQGFVDCTNKAKSVYLTSGGVEHAEETLALMGLGHLVDEMQGGTARERDTTNG